MAALALPLATLVLSAALILSTEAGKLRQPWPENPHEEISFAWTPVVWNVSVLGSTEGAPQEAHYIAIVSDMRSGTTAISRALSQNNACVYNCNELFADQADEVCKASLQGGINSLAALETMQNMRTALDARGMPTDWHNPDKPGDVGQMCKGRSVITTKLFELHNVVGQNLENFLLDPHMRVVVIERDPVERWCSFHWARTSEDWGTHPGHVEANERPPCPKTAPVWFLKHHVRWFKQVRDTLAARSGLHMEVPFTEIRRNMSAVVSMIQDFANL